MLCVHYTFVSSAECVCVCVCVCESVNTCDFTAAKARPLTVGHQCAVRVLSPPHVAPSPSAEQKHQHTGALFRAHTHTHTHTAVRLFISPFH